MGTLVETIKVFRKGDYTAQVTDSPKLKQRISITAPSLAHELGTIYEPKITIQGAKDLIAVMSDAVVQADEFEKLNERGK